MPRITQNSEKYAKEDFQKEIRSKQGYHDLMSQRALADAAGIPHSTLWAKLKDPDKLEVADLRKLVKTICPDPLILLALVGYSKQDMKRVRKILEETA